MGFVLHTSVPPSSLADAARRAVMEVDPRLTPYGIAPLSAAVRRSMATTRYVVTLMIVFAALGITLAAVGLYGVMAYSVRLRFTELGLRKALGATSSKIFSSVLAEALALVSVGVILGALGAYALGGVVESILFGVSRVDARHVCTGDLRTLRHRGGGGRGPGVARLRDRPRGDDQERVDAWRVRCTGPTLA